jgi:hypothetical protein
MLGTDARRRMSQLRGARGALAGNYAALAVAVVSQLVLLPLLLARLGATDAGVFVLLWSAVNFAGTAIGWLSAGGTVMLTQAAAAGNERMLFALYRRFARGLAWYGVAAWVLFAVWSLFVGTWWLRELPVGSAAQIRLAAHGAGLYMLAIDVHQADLALLIARLAQGRVAVFRAGLQVLMFGLGAGGLLWGGGVAGLFFGYALAAIMIAISAHILVRRTAWPRPSAEASVATVPRDSLSRFAGYSVVSGILQYSDALILSVAGGPATVVTLTFLQRLPEAASVLVGRASETLGPYYTTMSLAPDRAPLQRTYFTASRVIWRVAAVTGAGFAVFGRDVVQWWSQGRLELPPHWFFAGAGFVLMATIVNRNAAWLSYFTGAPRASTRLLMVELGLRVVLVFALVRPLGATAPMVAALVAQATVLLIAYRKLERDVLRVEGRALLATGVLPALTSAVPATVLMLALRATSVDALAERGAAVVVATIAVAALLAFQERALALQFLRRRHA